MNNKLVWSTHIKISWKIKAALTKTAGWPQKY